jgi:hypothetical protein
VQTHHYLNSKKNFKKSFQSETKEIKNVTAKNMKGKWEEESMCGKFP